MKKKIHKMYKEEEEDLTSNACPTKEGVWETLFFLVLYSNQVCS